MRKSMALLVAFVSLLSLAACSTKSNDSLSATTTTESRTGEDDDTTTTTRSSSSGTSGSGQGSPAPLSLTECAQAAAAFAALGLGFGGDSGQAQELENELNELETKIPDQIRDDFETVRNAYQAYFDALRDAGGNIFDPDVQQQLEDASDELDKPEVEAASDRISDYFSNTCGR
jgi:hypothetical protein